MNPWIWLAGIAVVGLAYVVLPVAADAYLRFRGPRTVRCPETAGPARIALDAGGAALTALFREPQPRVRRCSEWPARRGCRQACLAEPPEAAA